MQTEIGRRKRRKADEANWWVRALGRSRDTVATESTTPALSLLFVTFDIHKALRVCDKDDETFHRLLIGC